MDPITTAVLATAIAPLVSGAAGEAGKQAWQSLVAKTRGLLGSDAPTTQAVATLTTTPADPRRIEAVSATLAADAATHPELAVWLHDWLAAAPTAIVGGDVTNTISGNVDKAVMGRDFTGPVTFGS